MNGLTVQWGTNDTTDARISFFVSFSNTNYFTNAGFVIANCGSQNVNKFETYMECWSVANNSGMHNWIAIGY